MVDLHFSRYKVEVRSEVRWREISRRRVVQGVHYNEVVEHSVGVVGLLGRLLLRWTWNTGIMQAWNAGRELTDTRYQDSLLR